MKNLAITLTVGLFLTACGPSAQFSTVEDGNLQSSLLNGESIEVVDNDQIFDPIDDGDVIVQNPIDDGDDVAENPIANEPAPGKEDSDCKNCEEKEQVKKERSCKKERIRVTVEELENDQETLNLIACGEEEVASVKKCDSKKEKHGHKNKSDDEVKKVKKYAFCHHPGGDASKRKTLCLPLSAIKGRLSAQDYNFAGACK